MTIAPEARTCAAELNVKDLAIGHNGKTLLKHLTFSVPAGSSLAIVGESGCGKSTLLTTLAGLLQRDQAPEFELRLAAAWTAPLENGREKSDATASALTA